MINEEKWTPSRFLLKGGKLVEDRKKIFPGSWFMCQRFAPFYQNAIANHISGDILDCGCGQVPYYELYKPRAKTITCVDWEKSPHETNHIDHAVDLNAGLPFGDNSFDSIILTDVLEHIYAPRILLNSVSKVLRPRGEVVIGVPFLYRIHERPHDFYRYTEFALQQMLQEIGMEIVKINAYGGYLDVLFDLIHKKATRNRFTFSVIQGLRKCLLAIPFIRKFNNDSKSDYPLGYCVVARKI